MGYVLGRKIYDAPHNACLRELICNVGDYIATNFIIIIDIIYEYLLPFKLLSHLILFLIYQQLGVLKNFALHVRSKVYIDVAVAVHVLDFNRSMLKSHIR